MSTPDLAALRALVEEVDRTLNDPCLLGLHTDEPECRFCQIRVALDSALPAAREALERVEKIIGLQRAALASWEKAQPHAPNPAMRDLADLIRWKNACSSARGILRELEGNQGAAFAAVEKLEWIVGRAARLEAYVQSEAGLDCKEYDKHLSPRPCGACASCRARAALEGRDG